MRTGGEQEQFEEMVSGSDLGFTNPLAGVEYTPLPEVEDYSG